jgi:hypothetical protein
MSDYLSRLVSRTLNTARVLQPRVPNRFEPRRPVDDEQYIAVSSVERAQAASEPAAERSDRKPAREASIARAIEAPGQSHTVADRQAAASINRSTQAKRDGDLTGKTRHGAQETASIAVVASRPSPAIESTQRDVLVARIPSVPDAKEAPGRPFQRPTKPTMPEQENLRALPNRVDEPMDRGRLTATVRQAAAVVRETPAKPSINVRIGRIEVKAVGLLSSSPRRPAPRAPEPMLTLKDYLKARRERRR